MKPLGVGTVRVPMLVPAGTVVDLFGVRVTLKENLVLWVDLKTCHLDELVRRELIDTLETEVG